MNHVEILRAALEVISQHPETGMYCQYVAEEALAATAEPAQDDLTAQLADVTAERRALAEALRDMLNGWLYIRESHGDLYGVGWDRAQHKAEAALVAIAATKGEKT